MARMSPLLSAAVLLLNGYFHSITARRSRSEVTPRASKNARFFEKSSLTRVMVVPSADANIRVGVLDMFCLLCCHSCNIREFGNVLVFHVTIHEHVLRELTRDAVPRLWRAWEAHLERLADHALVVIHHVGKPLVLRALDLVDIREQTHDRM